MRQRAYLESAHRVKEVKPQAKVVCVYPGAAMRCCLQIGRMTNTETTNQQRVLTRLKLDKEQRFLMTEGRESCTMCS